MDYSELDKVRRSTTPLQLDVVESFVNGRLSRREFIQRGTIIGLSMASITAIIAACGGTTTSPGASGAAATARRQWAGGLGQDRRHDPGRRASVPSSVDPVAMQDLGGYGITAQSFEFLATQNTIGDRGRLAPGLATEWTPNADGTVWTFKLRAGREVAGRRIAVHRRPTSSPRWSAWSRPATPGSRASSTRAAPSRPTRTRSPFTLVGANGNFPYLVSIFNAQSLITPADYVAGHEFQRPADRDRRLEARHSYNQATGATFDPQSRLVGRQDAARRHRVDLLRRHRADGHRLPGRPGRRHRPVRRAHPARRCSMTRTSA